MDKIASLDKRIFKLKEEKDNLETRVVKNNVDISNKTVAMETNLANSIKKLKEEMSKDFEKMAEDLKNMEVQLKE